MLLKKIYLCTMNIKRKKTMVVGTLDLGYKREQEIMIFKVGRWAMRGILFFKSFFLLNLVLSLSSSKSYNYNFKDTGRIPE